MRIRQLDHQRTFSAAALQRFDADVQPLAAEGARLIMTRTHASMVRANVIPYGAPLLPIDDQPLPESTT